MKKMATALRPVMGTSEACRHVGISRAFYYRSRHPVVPRPKRRRKSRRRLSSGQRFVRY